MVLLLIEVLGLLLLNLSMDLHLMDSQVLLREEAVGEVGTPGAPVLILPRHHLDLLHSSAANTIGEDLVADVHMPLSILDNSSSPCSLAHW